MHSTTLRVSSISSVLGVCHNRLRKVRPEKAVRVSETIDIEDPEALLGYLRQAGRIGWDEQPRIHSLQGGVSNRTVMVERTSGEAWVLKQALAKLRVPVDWFSSPERICREALGLEWLGKLAPHGSITALLFKDHEQHLLAMEAVPQPHENWKPVLLAGRIEFGHFRQFAILLATIHREAYHRRADLEEIFADRSFFESLRLEPYYRYSAQQTPAASDFLESLVQETLAYRTTLVHGDFSPKNILIHRGRLVLLDHEVIHFGDPAFDLGFWSTGAVFSRPPVSTGTSIWTSWALSRGLRIWSREPCARRSAAFWPAWWAVLRWNTWPRVSDCGSGKQC
jgi:hypothetical protein